MCVSGARPLQSPIAYSHFPSTAFTHSVSSILSASTEAEMPRESNPTSLRRGSRPVAIRILTFDKSPPFDRMMEVPPSGLVTISDIFVDSLTSTPMPSKLLRTLFPASGSYRGRSSLEDAIKVTLPPNLPYAVAISHPTTPAPKITRCSGTWFEDTASREVQGCDVSRPGISGIFIALPVDSTTAYFAFICTFVLSWASTVTSLTPESRPKPLTTITLESVESLTKNSSSQLRTIWSLRAKVASTSTEWL